MSAWTPGPWVFDGEVAVKSAPLTKAISYTTADGTTHHGETGLVALVYACAPDGDFKTGTVDANARLIAAAPDLYASVRELREAVAAAMRVVADLDTMHLLGASAEARQQRFADELKIAGVANGFGKRADDLLARINGSAVTS